MRSEKNNIGTKSQILEQKLSENNVWQTLGKMDIKIMRVKVLTIIWTSWKDTISKGSIFQ